MRFSVSYFNQDLCIQQIFLIIPRELAYFRFSNPQSKIINFYLYIITKKLK